MSKKAWNLMFCLGNTGEISGDYANPYPRRKAIAGAKKIATWGWRVWVEHNKTGKRIWESAAEKAARHPPEPSGPGLREIQQIQNERMDKWMGSPLTVKLPPSLQAAKDAAKRSAAFDDKPTCEDCRFCEPTTKNGLGECKVPLPYLIRASYGPFYVALCQPACEECFERKEAK